MPALSFKKQFAPLVESGEKRQTIREYRKDGRNPKAGDTLYLYTGMRTKSCRKLREATCIATKSIDIVENLGVMVDGLLLDQSEARRLAEADGFREGASGVGAEYYFLDFFRDTHGLPFRGLLIFWE